MSIYVCLIITFLFGIFGTLQSKNATVLRFSISKFPAKIPYIQALLVQEGVHLAATHG